MPEKTTQEFIENADPLLIGAVTNYDFVKIKTKASNAMLISEIKNAPSQAPTPEMRLYRKPTFAKT